VVFFLNMVVTMLFQMRLDGSRVLVQYLSIQQ